MVFFIQLNSLFPILDFPFRNLKLSLQEYLVVYLSTRPFLQGFSFQLNIFRFLLDGAVLLLRVPEFILLSQDKNNPVPGHAGHNHSAHIRRVLSHHS